MTTLTKSELLAKKADLETELTEINAKLTHIERMEKPWEAVVEAYSGTFSTFWKTEEAARKKMDEYHGKMRYLNGLVYGVRLVNYYADGSKEIVDERAKTSYYRPKMLAQP
ncbi:hypothetical protein [Paenibacillus agricola]|uniref:Uncharacterized protein n=1 Tax=Paenibacillus agricola TaxID=2716264 RepID=A0ABX0J4Y2_9BACL|nr:hypothetical protein [Paenibacillus agricola]NHN31187.1 hypothetical protein [Paenibacillus agricola]